MNDMDDFIYSNYLVNYSKKKNLEDLFYAYQSPARRNTYVNDHSVAALYMITRGRSIMGVMEKTILTANIASFLTDIGKKCLIIDCDAATHGMTLLYLVEVSANSNSMKKGVFNISDTSEIPELLKTSLVNVENGIDLLPATYNFKPGFDPEEKFIEDALLKVVEKMKSSYDFILLDAQAGSDKYSKLAMNKNISDEVIIVSEYDPLSAAGIERLKQVVGDDLDFTRTWVLLNKMLPEFVNKFSEFLSITKYLPPIPWNAEVVRSYAKRKLALDLDKGNTFTLAVMRTVKALLGDSIEGEINLWTGKRSYALKEPLEEQYTNAEKELKYALEAQQELEIKYKKKRLFRAYIIIVPMMLVPYIIYKFLLMSESISIFREINVLMVLGGSLAVLLPILFTITSKLFGSARTTESSRNKRIIEVLEEKLKQLESLRSADLETMLKDKEM
jgi:cellulose biosynthesis protein BcsQ